MTRFMELFELYLGTACYSSFVMRMDLARRKILQGGLPEVDRCLPNLAVFDERYGTSSRRPLDIVLIRMESLYQYKKYKEVKDQALILIQRAVLIDRDTWQNLYFLIKRWYYLGTPEFFLKEYFLAVESLKTCLNWNDEFCKIDNLGTFNAEKVDMMEKLEFMADASGDQQSASEWHARRDEILGEIAAVTEAA